MFGFSFVTSVFRVTGKQVTSRKLFAGKTVWRGNLRGITLPSRVTPREFISLVSVFPGTNVINEFLPLFFQRGGSEVDEGAPCRANFPIMAPPASIQRLSNMSKGVVSGWPVWNRYKLCPFGEGVSNQRGSPVNSAGHGYTARVAGKRRGCR